MPHRPYSRLSDFDLCREYETQSDIAFDERRGLPYGEEPYNQDVVDALRWEVDARADLRGLDGEDFVEATLRPRKNPRSKKRARRNSGVLVEAPRDLREQVSWRVVQEGLQPDLEEEISWRGPTKEPFLSLWSQGWRKYKARHVWGGRVMVLHFWMSPYGARDHIKIKNSPLDQGAVPLRNPRRM